MGSASVACGARGPRTVESWGTARALLLGARGRGRCGIERRAEPSRKRERARRITADKRGKIGSGERAQEGKSLGAQVARPLGVNAEKIDPAGVVKRDDHERRGLSESLVGASLEGSDSRCSASASSSSAFSKRCSKILMSVRS